VCGTEYGGAVSDVIRVPHADAMLVALPAGLEPSAAAALGDNAVDGLRTVPAALARARREDARLAGCGRVDFAGGSSALEALTCVSAGPGAPSSARTRAAA
jgi:hypothetical protein